EILVRLIERLGGDPSYISPSARVAQVRGEQSLELPMRCTGLAPEEVDAMDLESVALAETKDHADWEFLAQLLEQIDDPSIGEPLQEALHEVGDEETE